MKAKNCRSVIEISNIKDIIGDGIIKPTILQILPTNRCNLNCSFCCCSKRNKEQEIDFDLLKKIILKFKMLGTKHVSISGGGEPTLYSHVNEMIEYIHSVGINNIGLVTNGLALNKIKSEILNRLSWCRISNSDERVFTKEYSDYLFEIINKTKNIDWGFNHVLSTNPNLEEIGNIVEFANRNNFTHVGLGSDVFIQEVDMNIIKEYLTKNKISDSIITYHSKIYTVGGDCYMGYHSPLIAPDAKLYYCCNVQNSFDQPLLDFPQELCLGDAINIDSIIRDSFVPKNGHICTKCNKMPINNMLKTMIGEYLHEDN